MIQTFSKIQIWGGKLENEELNIPKGRALPNDEIGEAMPFVVLGDEAFGLSKNVLRPFPRKNADVKKKVFNYRHTRARRMIECCLLYTSRCV